MTKPLSTEQLVIPSSVDHIEKVDEFVERFATALGFDRDALADIGICVTELVMNAIVHAHKEKSDLPVQVDVEQHDSGLRVTVRDHGPGFDTETVPDPTSPENLLDDHGRGILIVRAMMDDVQCTRLDDGMQIAFFKRFVPK
ncbi:MAG: ATP-binding protein [Calditrichaeota bacterium]|nr:ATP-binding protein [Calditrichota bacterium]MCB9366061.1 ATP-binding protein [Calditrichota bacterium]MCB9391813.1 ATP-binding protein [Calditrichota bacterium]